MRGARIILARELADLRRSPTLLVSMISLPAMLVGAPLLVVRYLIGNSSPVAVAFIHDLYGVSSGAPAQVIVEAAALNWLPLFLVMPVFLPILIAAQSIGGERERRTLEPLLATPISTTEIVLGKSLAAVLPAVLITWAAAVVFVVGMDAFAFTHGGSLPLPDTEWVFSIVVLSPLLAMFGNTLAVVVSARVNDARAAQNIAAMSLVPLVGLVVAQVAGKVGLGLRFYLILGGATCVVNVALVALAAALFNRERLLTRWR